jgi:hypothetical protein
VLLVTVRPRWKSSRVLASHDLEICFFTAFPVSVICPDLSHLLTSPTDSQSVFSFRNQPPPPSPPEFPNHSDSSFFRLRNLSQDPDPSLPCNIASPQHLLDCVDLTESRRSAACHQLGFLLLTIALHPRRLVFLYLLNIQTPLWTSC